MKRDFAISELQKIEEAKYTAQKTADDVLEYQKNLSEINRHIAVLNDDLTRNSLSLERLTGDIKVICERLDWLVKFFWIIISVSVGSLATSLFNLILK